MSIKRVFLFICIFILFFKFAITDIPSYVSITMATSSERSIGYIRKFLNVGGLTLEKFLEPQTQVGISPKLLTPTALAWEHSKTMLTIREICCLCTTCKTLTDVIIPFFG